MPCAQRHQWTAKEDDHLRGLVEKHGTRWKTIERQRWSRYFKPTASAIKLRWWLLEKKRPRAPTRAPPKQKYYCTVCGHRKFGHSCRAASAIARAAEEEARAQQKQKSACEARAKRAAARVQGPGPDHMLDEALAVQRPLLGPMGVEVRPPQQGGSWNDS